MMSTQILKVVSSNSTKAEKNEKQDEHELIASKFEILGKVVGVFFRMHLQKQCEILGIRGWCKISPQGTIVGRMQGEAGSLANIKNWIENVGAPKSRVIRVEFKHEASIPDYTYAAFAVR